MKFLSRIIFFFLVNLIGLIVASYLIEGFSITSNFENLLILTGIFTAINILIKPIIKFIFTPFIVLTLGLFSLVINATILKLLDIWSENVNILGIQALIYATLIITVVNLILTFVAKSSFKKTEN
jgi:putative membrane protein